jgi:predicted nucleic acid-binding protein
MIVVADTGPVNYLVLSGQVDLAHDLYRTLLIPPAVHRELLDARAPAAVRQ